MELPTRDAVRGKTPLTVDLGALRLANPVLVASGTFGYASELAGLVDLARLGGIVTKTVTVKPRPGNPPPRIVETPAGMLNAIGLQNVGIDRFVTEKLPYLAGLDPVVLVSDHGLHDRRIRGPGRAAGRPAGRGWVGTEPVLSQRRLQRGRRRQDVRPRSGTHRGGGSGQWRAVTSLPVM